MAINEKLDPSYHRLFRYALTLFYYLILFFLPCMFISDMDFGNIP